MNHDHVHAIISRDRFKPAALTIPLAIAAVLASNQPAIAFELEEIVVTAQKREQSLHDVPMFVSVVSAETLDSSNQELQRIGQAYPGRWSNRRWLGWTCSTLSCVMYQLSVNRCCVAAAYNVGSSSRIGPSNAVATVDPRHVWDRAAECWCCAPFALEASASRLHQGNPGNDFRTYGSQTAPVSL